MTDTSWFNDLINALGAHMGHELPVDSENVVALEDERGRVQLVIELSPREFHINLYAPFLDYDPSASPELELFRARSLLEWNSDADALEEFVICGDQARDQYVLRGAVGKGVNSAFFIDTVTRLVERAAQLHAFLSSADAQPDGEMNIGQALSADAHILRG